MDAIDNRTDRQRGAALIVGLVLMTVLTLLAVSTMRTSTLELAMAGNAQYHEQALQLAETGIADAIDRINNGGLALRATDGWTTLFSVNAQSDGKNIGKYDVTISFKERGTINANNSPTPALLYEIESTGASVARNAKSTLRQGIWIREGGQG